MGSSPSKRYEGDRNRAKQIDNQLMAERRAELDSIKLLLLGGSESGKTTIVKQMQIIHLSGFDEVDIINFRFLIFFNIVEGLKKLLAGAEQLEIELDMETKVLVEKFYNTATEGVWDVDALKIGQEIWNSNPIQEAFAHKDQFQLGDNVEHFMTSLPRIAQSDFKPNEMDMIFCRAVTTGVHEIKFPYKQQNFRVIDVGGQKSERRKWIHCFEGVTAVMFVAALSGYDQVLEEDKITNRMQDALTLFNDIYNNEYFKKSSALLFLNKKDVFEKKISKVPLTVCFEEYGGSNTYDEASEYIRAKFLEGKSGPSAPKGREVYSHFTNATDTGNIDLVFRVAADIIIKKNQSSAGIY